VIVALLPVLGQTLASGIDGPPSPPPDAITCPYPPASSILPCECLAEPHTFRIYLYCRWTMGQNNTADSEAFQGVMDQFDTYNQIYVMQMTCDNCWDFELDGLFHENTTGKFEMQYFTVEDFEPTTLGVEHQFSGRALETSRASLLYAKLTPFHYFTPDLHFLSGMVALEQLYLQHLDSDLLGLPDWGTLTNLRFLSLLDGNFGSLSSSTFSGLELLSTLFLDRCQISSLGEATFSSLPALTHLSLSHNNFTKVPSGTFNGTSSLLLVNLGESGIEEVEDSFDGASTDIQILLQGNFIRTLPEVTWRPLTERILHTPLAQGQVDLYGNPLDCGCDVKWLIVDLGAPEVFVNARCANGDNLLDLDPEILEFFCPHH